MRKILILTIAVILSAAAWSLADDNPFESGGGKFRLISCAGYDRPFYIEFKDGKFSIIKGPSGYYSFEKDILKIIRSDNKGEKVIFSGRVTKNDANFIRAENGKKKFDFYRCDETYFNNVKSVLIASRKIQ